MNNIFLYTLFSFKKIFLLHLQVFCPLIFIHSQYSMGMTDDSWHYVCVLLDGNIGLLAVFKDGHRNFKEARGRAPNYEFWTAGNNKKRNYSHRWKTTKKKPKKKQKQKKKRKNQIFQVDLEGVSYKSYSCYIFDAYYTFLSRSQVATARKVECVGLYTFDCVLLGQ